MGWRQRVDCKARNGMGNRWTSGFFRGPVRHLPFMKTPVEEYLTVDDSLSELVLNSTRYHSFGVGLPFMESDGEFYQDGDDFVMDHMNRHFDSLSLRTGLGTKLTLELDNQSYPVYENHEPGYRVDIFIAPRAYGIPCIKHFFGR